MDIFDIKPVAAPVDAAEAPHIHTEYVTGIAGTGKTFEMRRRIDEDKTYGVLAATTGIAAVNLGTTTINSLLKYFDTASLEDAYVSGRLHRRLRQLVDDEGVHHVVIDEMDGIQLDLLYRAVSEVHDPEMGRVLGIVVTGDFCQLPPVRARWAFEADCWPRFEANTVRLDHAWRHSDARFLEALNHVRAGRGSEGAELIHGMSEFANACDMNFQGTTVSGTNDEVERYNKRALGRLLDRSLIVARSTRWGYQRREWKLVPFELELKMDAYVMVLANSLPSFEYVNGDCGWIRAYDHDLFAVELVRTGATVWVPRITRCWEQHEEPSEEDAAEIEHVSGRRPYHDERKKRWIVGEVTYHPLRLAYAATVHKTQGLTLDRVQIDTRGGFMGQPAMMYVALSRCRTPQGLRIVGTRDVFAARVAVAEEVKRWL